MGARPHTAFNTFVCVFGEFAPIWHGARASKGEGQLRHETCNVRTQMPADMKHAMWEHICRQTGTVQGARCMQTGTVQLRCEHRDAMSVSESIDSSRLFMSASELRAKSHRRGIEQIKK